MRMRYALEAWHTDLTLVLSVYLVFEEWNGMDFGSQENCNIFHVSSCRAIESNSEPIIGYKSHKSLVSMVEKIPLKNVLDDVTTRLVDY